jgi:hypothetical protein
VSQAPWWRGLAAVGAVGAAALAGLTGCGSQAPGMCGAYTETAGTARITSVVAAPADESNCPTDPVRVLFDFQPIDPARVALSASGVALTIGSGLNPPRAWITASGLAVGSAIPAVRSDQPFGPCTPTVFEFARLDMAAALAACR